MKNENLILVDPNRALCTSLQERFSSLPNVAVVNGRFEQLRESIAWSAPPTRWA